MAQGKPQRNRHPEELSLEDCTPQSAQLQALPESAQHKLTLRLSEPYLSHNKLRKLHFAQYKKLRERYATEILVCLGGRRPKVPIERAFVVIRRYESGEGLDWDNALGGLKPLLDCLVMPSARSPSGMGLIVDDKLKHLPYPPFVEQYRSPGNQGATVIDIYELPSS